MEPYLKVTQFRTMQLQIALVMRKMRNLIFCCSELQT